MIDSVTQCVITTHWYTCTQYIVRMFIYIGQIYTFTTDLDVFMYTVSSEWTYQVNA